MTTATKERTIVQPFGVEADHPRNADILLGGIQGHVRLRGGLDASKPGYGKDAGVPSSQYSRLGNLPKIPGMQIHVNPTTLVYKVTDPLHDDEELCRLIERRLKEQERPVPNGKIVGCPPQKGKMNVHRMKTLCRELLFLLDEGHVKLVKGPMPTIEDIGNLPGRFLQNAAGIVKNSQPVFEDEMDEWEANLSRLAS